MSNKNVHKPGYHHTPLGWIPKEWEAVTIEQLLERNILLGHLDGNHGGLYPRAEEFVSEGVPYITANNFASGYVKFDECKYLMPEKAKQFRKGVAKNGDVLFAHNATVGPVAVLDTRLEFVILSTTATYFRCNMEFLNNQYLKEFFTSGYFVQQYERVMGQSTRNQVPITTQRLLYTILPPIEEQQRIATILTSWDEAIQKTQQLIEQLKQRNKGLMQQLLTGKKRLNGFSGKWKQVQVRNIADEVGMKNKGGKELTVLSCTKYHGLVDSLEYFGRRVFSEDTSTYKVVPNAHFAYATNHIEEGSIGYQDRYDEALISPMYTVFKTRKGVNNAFLYKVLKSQHYIHEYQKRMEGSIDRRGGLRWDEFSKIPVSLPEIEEQTAIANVLDKANSELKLQEQQLTTLQEQKKGLMQKLLSGEVRVKA